MGGYGSGGRNDNGYGTVEGTRHLDVNVLRRNGVYHKGRKGTIHWGDSDDQDTPCIKFHMVEDDVLVLTYNYRPHGGDWEDVEQPIRITGFPRHLGGQERYFVCSAVGCGRRVEKLFGAGKYFACRHCYRLTYRSQRERGIDRVLSQMNQIRMSLGGEQGGTSVFMLPRPRYMRHKRYKQFQNQLYELEMQAEEITAKVFVRLMKQSGNTGKELWK